jgi:two-component system CheB/CheR fusion protein
VVIKDTKRAIKNKKMTAEANNLGEPINVKQAELAEENPPIKWVQPIVVIGASAGGLESLNQFFPVMPASSGCAFVIVSHLDPKHVSVLSEIIQHKTTMKVSLAKEGVKVSANCVYVIPPNKNMTIANSVLHLHELTVSSTLSHQINTFFHSVASDQGENAIAIILSGSGSDGTEGISAIHHAGGMVIAESRDSAKFKGMPESAIASGNVDFILPVTDIPNTLLDIIGGNINSLQESPSSHESRILAALPEVFALLFSATQQDFSNYKTTTICRRIERRMAVHHMTQISDYLCLLRDNAQEVMILYKQLLIGVTRFFRDVDAFEQLENKHLLELIRKKPANDPLRIWVAGCSSGEEVYSIAIIVDECMEQLNRQFEVQIFGTDIDEAAISIARAGIYPKIINQDISPQRLNNYFVEKSNGYQVSNKIRETVIFAVQNLTSNPPFSKLDLLCCRNLLIYFTQDLQRKILPLFHYSLKADGLLFLGSSESLGPASILFSVLDKKCKIFKKLPNMEKKYPLFNLTHPKRDFSMYKTELSQQKKTFEEVNSLKLLKAMLYQSGMPASAIINEQGEIVYVHGKLGPYLELPEGLCDFNILNMAKLGLKISLSKAIDQLHSDHKAITIPKLRISDKQSVIHFNLILKPLPEFKTAGSNLTMVIFEEIPVKKEPSTITAPFVNSAQFEQLTEELRYTKESLQSHIEELETSNEDMIATNEELQSTNEELQSSNEELETSREELQSLNEESSTVGAELKCQVDDLMKANDDIKNLLDTTNIATIFLDTHCAVRLCTPQANKIFPLTNADIGRPLSHFASKLVDVNVEQLSLQVLDNLLMKELEVRDVDNNILRMCIRPYRTLKNLIDGVVITFEDISKIKKVDAMLQISSDNLQENMFFMSGAFLLAPHAMIIKDLNGLIIALNEQAVKLYGWSREELLGQPITMLTPEKYLQQMVDAASLCHNHKENIVDIATYRLTKSGETIAQKETLSRMTDVSGKVCAVVYTIN